MTSKTISSDRMPVVALAVIALLAVGGVGFYGWLLYGADILLSAASAGISWCL